MIIVESFQDHFRTILGPPYAPKIFFQSQINFLEMAHTNFVSSIRKEADQLLI